MAKDKLVTSGYCLILAANFLLYFAFYLILPVLPFYLTEVFHTGNAAVGVILSCYTIASLCIRPFSGYLLDTLARKPLYLVAYFIFITIFAGYMLAGVLSIFIMLRVVHGLAFGMVTVAGNTIVIDITPSSRRGEAVGYYGLMNNTAMSFGPMIGLFMHDIYSFETIFTCSLISGTIGFVAACLVKTPPKQPVKREPISLDRFCATERYPGRNRTALAFHTIWHDKYLCSHVCQRNRNYLEFRIVLYFYGRRHGSVPYVLWQTSG